MGVHRSRVTGLGANGLASESVSIDPRGNATTNRVFRNRASAEEIAWIKYPTSATPAVTTSTNGLVRSSTSQTGVTTTFAYDAFQREVSQTDGRGNTTRTTYDNFGRVTSTIDALGFATTYGYDALGRRVSTTTTGGTRRHVYDDNWQVIADLDEQNNAIASYTWGDGIDNLLAVKVGGASYYPLADIQGTIWGCVDSQNNVVARWRYDAWGNVLSEYVAPVAVALASLRYRFQCREWSAATGLTNFRMRWYDAETGRWLSKDPIGLTGGLNLYAFCDDTPIVYADPRGERWASVIVGGAILGVGYIIIRHAIDTKRTFDNANVDDLRDIASKMVDCAEDTMIAVTPIFGPPNPDVSIPLTDKATDVIARPLWKRVFDKIRPTR